MKKTKIVHLVAVALALVAMILPYGSICRIISPSATGVQHETLETYSYFDLFPFGYGNFAPFLTAILTVAVLALLVSYMCFLKESRMLQIVLMVISCAAFVFSLLPLVLYGLKFFNATAMIISYLLGLSAFFSYQRLIGRYFVSPYEEDETEE